MIKSFINFLNNPEQELGINLQDPLEKVNLKFGNPTKIVGDSRAGYLYFGAIRIGYFGDFVDEIAIEFKKRNTKFRISIEQLKDEITEVNWKTKIHQFIHVMNYSKINWNTHNTKDDDYFYLKLESGLFAIFYLYSGDLNLITMARTFEKT